MKKIFAIAPLMFAVASANAGLTVTGVNSDFATAGDDSGSLGLVQQGNVVGLTEGVFDVTFTAIFKEAAFTNFFIAGVDLLSTGTIGSSFTTQLSGVAPLDFSFLSSGGAFVHNSNNTAQFLSGAGGDFATVALENGSFLLGFNDASLDPTAGDFIDVDYDDLVIRVDAVAVPEPGAMALLGLGMAGLGMTRLQKRRSATA